MKVSVIGLGKAGLPLAAVMADAGLDVLGVDVSAERVAMINRGENPIPEEKGLAEIITAHHGKNLIATTSYEEALQKSTAFVIIVPLFIDESTKQPDFSILDYAFSEVSKGLKDNDLVILETTVPPGTTKKRFLPILERSGKKFHLAYSPERIMTGQSISRYKEFPKVVGGIDDESTEKAFELYARFCNIVNKVSDTTTAELAKVSEGVYRDVNIALANELYKISEELGVDYAEMRENANHEFCHLHKPGHVGGHCIPVYPWFLINQFDAPLMRQSREINDSMIDYVIDGIPSGVKSVLVKGLTYRPGVKELAYTRSIPLIKHLEKKGYDVYVYDELFSKEEIEKMGYRWADPKVNGFHVIDMKKPFENPNQSAHIQV